MRLLVFVTVALLGQQIGLGQNNGGYVVKAGEVPGKVVPISAKYSFANFTNGIVYQRNGQASAQRLNYNIMLDEMQFIDPRGDTLTIAEPAMVKLIRIDSTEFYYDKTYLQIISSVPPYTLAIKQFFVQTPYRTRGGYGTSSGASAITTYTSMGFGGRPATNLQVDKDVAFNKMANFYVGDGFNHFNKADKKTFFNMFPERKSSIEKYLQENKTDFLNPRDLKNLLEYCARQ